MSLSARSCRASIVGETSSAQFQCTVGAAVVLLKREADEWD
jgi:hypothetical protein